MATIFLIEQSPDLEPMLRIILDPTGHQLQVSRDVNSACAGISDQDVRLIVINGASCADAFARDEAVLSSLPLHHCIYVAGRSDLKTAERLFRQGLIEYLEREAALGYLKSIAGRVDKMAPIDLANNRFKDFGIIGRSYHMNKAFDVAEKAARTDASVLILGETGTGKELFARAIHEKSPRSNGNLIVVDCASIPENLIESLLFGHVKGAFTGANENFEGLVKRAHGGTLFLDEVGELPPNLQTRFLRVLQEKKFTPIGSTREVHSDFRLIAATNQDLQSQVEAKQFRGDLFYRLKSIKISLPPLRMRGQDIVLLAEYFLSELNAAGNARKILSDEIIIKLSQYNWPGNVRELENTIYNLFTLSGDLNIIYPEHLPQNLKLKIMQARAKERNPMQDTESTGISVMELAETCLPSYKEYRRNIIEELDRQYFVNLLKASNSDIKQACSMAKLSRARVYELYKKYSVSQNIQ